LTVRTRARLSEATIAVVAAALLLTVSVSRPAGQIAQSSITLLSRDQRRAVPVVLVGTQEFVALDDLASAFQLTVREESGAITVAYRGRTLVLTTDQALASVSGRLISLPAPPTRSGSRWLVPVEFISRALALIYDQRLDLRRPSHLVVIGDLRVPRVSIRYEPLANASRITIDAAPKAAATVTQDAMRLLVKFDADAVDAAIPTFQSQGFINAIRVIEPATIAVDLGARFGAYRASTEAIEDTTRVVLDVVGADTSTALPGRGVAPLPPPAPDANPMSALPAGIRTIAIDAGHGGDDIGVKGPGGTTEKDLTLAVARKLKAGIEGRLGIRVLLTRDEDRGVPIDDRVAIANNSKADLLISLHANASLRGTPSGASIYVAALGGKKASLAPERLPTLAGGLRDIELVEWDRAQLRYLDVSTRLADLMREQFQGHVPLDTQQVFTSGPLRVLESANMPAVLVEIGYLTNPDQERQLTGQEFQNTFAQAIIDTILRFRDYLDQNPERR